MLVSFAVTNWACFRDRQEFSMEATARADDAHAFLTGIRRIPRLNRVSTIYGPNGSGKSRLVDGLGFAKSFVLGSSKEGQAGERIRHDPFLFDVATRTQPTTFEVSFIQDGSTYEYGFAVDRHRVHEEWLLARPKGGRRRTLLERKYNPATGDEKWIFGASVQGPAKIWQAATRPNALLVSTAAQLNSDAFRPVVDWFLNMYVLSAGDLPPLFTIERIARDAQSRRRVLDMLAAADIVCDDIRTSEEMLSLDDMRQHLPPSLVERFSGTGQSRLSIWKAALGHAVSGSDDLHFLDLEEESDGTRRFFTLTVPWLDIQDQDMLLVVDELDRSLHPHLVASLVRRINNAGEDGRARRAQIVVTLHDVTLLQNALDRGQVWLTEKDRSSEAATLTPLSDFHPRPAEALMRGYLGGRYGGVPVVSES